jgi:hypothetical protein
MKYLKITLVLLLIAGSMQFAGAKAMKPIAKPILQLPPPPPHPPLPFRRRHRYYRRHYRRHHPIRIHIHLPPPPPHP